MTTPYSAQRRVVFEVSPQLREALVRELQEAAADIQTTELKETMLVTLRLPLPVHVYRVYERRMEIREPEDALPVAKGEVRA